MTEYHHWEWIKCPACGFDDWSHNPMMPPPSPGRDKTWECPECGQEGVLPR